ncbi:hypothetical protein JTE90_025921 [Oedothorax gibbosus]|uniref:Caspase-1 n=1 Tax=Oedothorax gibbosus TaxID=931172 RepID=A0AAV6UWD3_9ARAC|nr:hypothetical protein JTE90_025921 [Oedothorax gibbosus]
MSNLEENMDTNFSNDNVDARKAFAWFKEPEVEGVILGSPESLYYSMAYPKRGRCLIFNHKTFEPYTGLNVRNGTDADAARLYCSFKKLDFEVSLFTDLKVKEIEKELQKAGKSDHTDYSSFVCCVLSHGEHGILYAADGKYQTESVFAPFRGDACPSLAGKPKLFFIQACQGDKLDSGVNITCKESSDAGDSRTYRIPTCADFLICYSTVSGYYSWRNTTNGSWFIQALCAALQKYAKEEDLLSIMTIVNFRVAYDFESYTPNDSSMHLKRQVPNFVSTLTRKVKFPVA